MQIFKSFPLLGQSKKTFEVLLLPQAQYKSLYANVLSRGSYQRLKWSIWLLHCSRNRTYPVFLILYCCYYFVMFQLFGSSQKLDTFIRNFTCYGALSKMNRSPPMSNKLKLFYFKDPRIRIGFWTCIPLRSTSSLGTYTFLLLFPKSSCSYGNITFMCRVIRIHGYMVAVHSNMSLQRFKSGLWSSK